MKFVFDGKGFAKRIKMKRTIDNNMLLEDVAEQTGISKATLSRLERGHTPDIVNFYVVCKWLDSPMNKFFVKEKVK